jgi:effector-binding domain-containing protein
MQVLILYFYETIGMAYMKTLRRILLVFLCIALVFISSAYFLPRKIHVERSLSYNAPQKTVFDQINSLKIWEKWSPWILIDTTLQLSFSGPESGAGASYRWLSNNKNVGSGTVSLISSFPYDSLLLIMDFGEKGKSLSKFIFIRENKSTKVTWSLESDLGLNPFSRWFGLFSDRLIGPDLEQGLFHLEDLIEKIKQENIFEILEYEVPAQMYIMKRDTASPTTVSNKLADMYSRISSFMKSRNLSPTGAPVAVFHSYLGQSFDIEAGLPVASSIAVSNKLNFVKKDAQKVVMVKFLGSYNTISAAYYALNSYIIENELVIIGPPWEEYITNPQFESDSSKMQTNIFYPVQ